MRVEAYIHSLKDRKNDRNVLGEAEIIRRIGDNLYLAEYNGVRCTAIFNPFVSRYFVDDLYGQISEGRYKCAGLKNIAQSCRRDSR